MCIEYVISECAYDQFVPMRVRALKSYAYACARNNVARQNAVIQIYLGSTSMLPWRDAGLSAYQLISCL